MTEHLFVMRHGPTDMNAAGIIQGTLDASLTAEGRELAGRHARYLAARKLGAWRIVAGPLHRTRQTAEVARGILGGEIGIEPSLTEIGRGDLQGLRKDALPPPLDLAYQSFLSDPWNVRAPGEGGESFADVERRIAERAAPELRAMRAKPGPILVVTHGSVGKILVMILAGLDRGFVDRVPAKHSTLYHVMEDAGAVSLEVLDGKAGYARIDWTELPPRATPEA